MVAQRRKRPALCAIVGSGLLLLFPESIAFVPIIHNRISSSRDLRCSQATRVADSPSAVTFASQLNVLAGENVEISMELNDEELQENARDDDVYRNYEAQLNEMALNTSKDATIAGKAVDLVEQMKETTASVDSHIGSILLNILAYSTHPDASSQGEALLQSMLDEEDTSTPSPDTETYCAALELFMQHDGPERCQQLVDSIGTGVTTPVYNKLIQAYGKHRRLAQALEVFSTMQERDTKTWIQILRAHRHATRSQRQKLWRRIPERSLATFHAYLQAVSGPDEADVVFYELLAARLTPDDTTLWHMLRAYSKTQHGAGGVPCFKIQQVLVHGQEPLSERTRHAALVALLKTTSAIPLEVVQSLCPVDDDEDTSPRLQRLALKCCAKVETTNEEDEDNELSTLERQQTALEWALQLYNTHRESQLHGAFLVCVAHLLPASSASKRDAMAQTVLERARERGEVDAYVLEQFRHVASERVQLQVFGGFWDEIGGSIPEAWSRNVGGTKRA